MGGREPVLVGQPSSRNRWQRRDPATAPTVSQVLPIRLGDHPWPAEGMIAPQTVVLGLGSVFSALASEGKPLLWWASEIGSAALLLTAATLFWTLRLQRLVRERTAELEFKNRELERESADRRQALEALQLSDNRLRMAMEAAQLRTWHWDIATDRFELVGDRTPEMGPAPPSSPAGLERFLAPIQHADIGAVRESLA